VVTTTGLSLITAALKAIGVVAGPGADGVGAAGRLRLSD
jgi:hypothetical protein